MPRTFISRSHAPLTSVIAAVSIALFLFVEPALARQTCGGVSLPEQVDAFGLKLVQNGVGIRRATFLNIHVLVAAIYVEKRTTRAEQILRPELPKVLRMQFLRDITRKQYVDGMFDTMKEANGKRYSMMEPQLNAFAKLIPDLPKGSQMTIAYHPQQGVVLSFNGKRRGSVPAPDNGFGNALFANMVGPKAEDEDLRASLLGGACE
jgi:hypothetical protein